MKLLMYAQAAVLALSLGACATPAPAGPSAPMPLPAPTGPLALTKADEQALLAVELSYRVALDAANVAVDARVLKGANAQRVLDLLTIARGAVHAARSAYDAGNGVAVNKALADAVAAISGARAILGR